MKQIQRRPWMALICPGTNFTTLFILLNIFSSSYSYASGSKLPVLTDSGTVVTDTTGNTIPSTTGGGTITAPSTTGGGTTTISPTTGGGTITTPPTTGGGTTTTSPTTGGGTITTPPTTGGGTTTTPPTTGGGTITTPPTTGGGASTALTFNRPWAKSGTSIVIDAFEGNSIDWDKMATDKKVAAVIHRSSIGQRVDAQYKARKKIALDRGYLWGAYHLGYKGNTIAQADLFLSLVQDEPNTLMILDLENTSSANLMSIDEAVTFMEYVHQKTGRIPTVYANHSTTVLLNQKVKNNPLFQQSKLWYARFTSSVTDFPKGIWNNYFLWQFSSEINCSSTGSCLYNVPGTSFDMDIDVFYGTASELAARWNND